MLAMVVANPLKLQHKILFASCLYKCMFAMVVANPQKFIKFSLYLAYINVYRSRSITLQKYINHYYFLMLTYKSLVFYLKTWIYAAFRKTLLQPGLFAGVPKCNFISNPKYHGLNCKNNIYML